MWAGHICTRFLNLIMCVCVSMRARVCVCLCVLKFIIKILFKQGNRSVIDVSIF